MSNICFLLTLTAVLLLVHDVKSANLYKTTRVLRDVQKVRPFSSNHPPSVESYVPVTVIYDNEEDINVLSKSIKQVESGIKESEENPKSSNSDNDDISVLKPEEHAVETHKEEKDKPVVLKSNEEESVATPVTIKAQDISSAGVDQETTKINKPSDAESVIKPKGRSLNTDAEPLNKQKNTRQRAQRRRLQRVNKANNSKTSAVKDDKTPQVVETINEKEEVKPSKIIENPIVNKELPSKTKFQKRTQQREPVVPIVESENYVFAHNGDYHYSYESGDGTKAFERGELKTIDEGSSGAGVVGGFSYKDDDGNDFSLSYTADENGYRPVGAHLPTPPPIPAAIQRALAHLATKTTPEPITERIKFN